MAAQQADLPAAPLTRRQQRFIAEYLVDLNGTQAAIRSGYSPKSARQSSTDNMKNPSIAEAIRKAMDRLAARTETKQDEVLTMLKREADGDGPDTLSRDRIRAAELLGKHLGMFTKRAEVDVRATGPAPVIQLVPRSPDDSPDAEAPASWLASRPPSSTPTYGAGCAPLARRGGARSSLHRGRIVDCGKRRPCRPRERRAAAAADAEVRASAVRLRHLEPPG